jgi:hypothetical protein
MKLFAFLLLTSFASARPGETIEEVEKRYGKHVKFHQNDSTKETREYRLKGLEIAVNFERKMSIQESFRRVDYAKQILTEISDGKPWEGEGRYFEFGIWAARYDGTVLTVHLRALPPIAPIANATPQPKTGGF